MILIEIHNKTNDDVRYNIYREQPVPPPIKWFQKSKPDIFNNKKVDIKLRVLGATCWAPDWQHEKVLQDRLDTDTKFCSEWIAKTMKGSAQMVRVRCHNRILGGQENSSLNISKSGIFIRKKLMYFYQFFDKHQYQNQIVDLFRGPAYRKEQDMDDDANYYEISNSTALHWADPITMKDIALVVAPQEYITLRIVVYPEIRFGDYINFTNPYEHSFITSKP